MRKARATIAALALALALAGLPVAALASEATLHDGGEMGIGLTTEVPERGDDPGDAGDAREGTRPMPQTGDPYAGVAGWAMGLATASGICLVAAGAVLRRGREKSQE